MRPSRARPVQGDVVRARLDALVAELGAAREAVPGDDVLAPDPPPVVDVGAEEVGVDPAPRRELPRAGVAAALRSAWVFGRAHAAVIGVIGLVALVGAVWAISQARTVPIAVAAPTPVAPVLATPSPTPTPVPLRVHVLGEVASPGVVSLPQGAGTRFGPGWLGRRAMMAVTLPPVGAKTIVAGSSPADASSRARRFGSTSTPRFFTSMRPRLRSRQ